MLVCGGKRDGHPPWDTSSLGPLPTAQFWLLILALFP